MNDRAGGDRQVRDESTASDGTGRAICLGDLGGGWSLLTGCVMMIPKAMGKQIAFICSSSLKRHVLFAFAVGILH